MCSISSIVSCISSAAEPAPQAASAPGSAPSLASQPGSLQGPARLGRGLSAALPPMDPTRLCLDYTQRDWARWGSFDLQAHTPRGITRKQHGMGGGEADALACDGDAKCAVDASGNMHPSTAAQGYFHLFRQQVLRSFLAESHKRFRRLQDKEGGRDDYLAQMQNDRQLPVEQVANQMSHALNQEYNHWRAQQRDRARAEVKAAHGAAPLSVAALDKQVDLLMDSTPFDPRSQPGCAPIIAWFSELMRVHMSYQCLDPELTLDNKGPYKAFGMWSSSDGSFEQKMIYWKAPGISIIYGHYLHLLDDALIRAVRRAMYASLAAQWAWHLKNSVGQQHHSESQWILRIAGFALHAFVLRRSEEELRSRGSWTDADEVRATDRDQGLWVTEELVAFSEELLGEMDTRFRTAGHTEFLSSYWSYTLDILGDVALHPPSQACYDMCWRLIERIQWDMAAHLMPSSGSFSGPSARSYDLFAGCNNTQDRVDFHLYFKHIFEPHASAPGCTVRTHSDGSEVKASLVLAPLLQPMCAAGAVQSGRLPSLLPPAGEIEPQFHRIWLAISQLAGSGSLPFECLQRLQLGMPYRVVEQRFSLVPGQERYNFHTPLLQIGHSGDDLISLPTAVSACARLAGPHIPGAPSSQRGNGGNNCTNCTSYVRIIPRVAATDPDPFYRSKPLAPAGDNRMAFPRQVTSQYQGFMLVTSLLAGTRTMDNATVRGSWESNLALPLGTDGLFADEVPLPREVGARMRIPPTAMFTVRHGDASVVVRIASFTKEDDVADSDATVAHASTGPDGDGGRQPFSVMWQVDDSSVLAGCGRIVVHHRHRDAAGFSAPPPKPYLITWLWGSGATTSNDEMRALTELVRQAQIVESVTPSPEWDERNQPRDSYPAPMKANCKDPVSHQRWTADAILAGGALKLSVARTDVYHPFTHHEAYKTPSSGPLHQKPYYTRDVVRAVNDQPILTWAQGEDPFRVRQFEQQQVFEPHRQGGCTQVFPQQPVTEHAA